MNNYNLQWYARIFEYWLLFRAVFIVWIIGHRIDKCRILVLFVNKTCYWMRHVTKLIALYGMNFCNVWQIKLRMSKKWILPLFKKYVYFVYTLIWYLRVCSQILEIYCDNLQLMLILSCKDRSACSIGSTQKRVPVLREFGMC